MRRRRSRCGDKAVLHLPGDHRIADYTDTVSVGDHDRSIEKARLLDPMGARHFTVAVLRE